MYEYQSQMLQRVSLFKPGHKKYHTIYFQMTFSILKMVSFSQKDNIGFTCSFLNVFKNKHKYEENINITYIKIDVR